jgi:hypothetical protein
MKHTKRTVKLLLILFFLSGMLLAQGQDVSESRQLDSESLATAYPPFGNVTIGDPIPLDEGPEEGGRLLFSTEDPDRGDPDAQVVGPNGFTRDFEIEFLTVLGRLEPGIYTVAATDAGLQLVESKVIVASGQGVPVHVTLVPIDEFQYDLANFTPYGDFRVGETEDIDDDNAGNVVITTNLSDDVRNDVRIFVTGPNDYRQNFTGNVDVTLTLETLEPGPYSIAATAEGFDLVEGKVDVQAGQSVDVTLTLVLLAGQ